MLPIYCDHFNLKREPFNITPDPGFFYLSESHKEALAQLVYGVKGRRGFVVLTGEVGTGKTTLIHCLLKELNGNTKTAMVFNMVVSAKDLLRYVCEKFGIVSPQDVHKEIHDYLYAIEQFLIASYRNSQNAALIIDEAQNLSTEVLESVRLLSNFETASDKLIQIFLVGQPELGIRLNAVELRQLKQRVALRHHLRPLNFSECKDYIQRRLEVAGGNINLFTSDALETIQECAGGIPRIVNILCDSGLLTAYALRKPAVEPEMIAEVARDLQLSTAPLTGHKENEPNLQSRATTYGNVRPVRLTDLRLNKPVHSSALKEPEGKAWPEEEGRNGSVFPQPVSQPDVLSQLKKDDPVAIQPQSGNVSSRAIEYLIAVFTEAMGPMASVILREHVSAMGESVDGFPKRRVAELVEELAGEIPTDSAKAKCKYAMLEGIRRLDGD